MPKGGIVKRKKDRAMVKLTIDGEDVEVPIGTTILKAAQVLGREIPVFCYHERLAIAGNCRMCLVEVEKSPKPVASCSMPVSDGMIVHTTSKTTENARKGVLEFLLINHPLDCPVCDQGGECDLQDITMVYGRGASRFNEEKRIVPDKEMGPLIKTSMTRCIHCTRCVRFSEDIAGMGELATTGRGENMEITSYLEQTVRSELSGNLVDLCPVGALTSKPYAFRGRPWELKTTETLDVLDALGSRIRVDTVGMRAVRVLPRRFDDVNEEWITDKTRHGIDGLYRQRLDTPYIRQDGALQPASWDSALTLVKNKLTHSSPQSVGILAGDMMDSETLFLMMEWMKKTGVTNRDCRQDGAYFAGGNRASYLFNTTLPRIAESDLCLMINVNVRAESPLVQARLRAAYLKTGLSSFYIGGALPQNRPLTFPYTNLGDDYDILNQLIDGSHALSAPLKAAKKPILIVGTDGLRGPVGPSLSNAINRLVDTYDVMTDDWRGFNILHRAAARVGALDLGFVPGSKGLDTAGIVTAAENGDLSVLYLLGADEIPLKPSPKTFVIYQGHHGDRGAAMADVILPGAAYTEKDGTFMNMEGRLGRTYSALCPPGLARSDWRIVAALTDAPYDNIADVRSAMARNHPAFGALEGAIYREPEKPQNPGNGTLRGGVFTLNPYDFYMTDPITRHSETMAKCRANAEGTYDYG